ncbi:hypothetical protein ACFQX8_09385 [Klenkia terrae]|uniref:hypothetical protein n=1 Tax=Klenkia terrae TaxID=1052259 RepID=UPI00361E009A
MRHQDDGTGIGPAGPADQHRVRLDLDPLQLVQPREVLGQRRPQRDERRRVGAGRVALGDGGLADEVLQRSDGGVLAHARDAVTRGRHHVTNRP